MQNEFNITVKKSFVDQCKERSKLYNPRGRTQERLLRDIEAEIFEWYMIDSKQAQDHPSWKVDMVLPNWGKVDVKLINKYYNISCTKLLNILEQEGEVDNYVFIEYINRPDRQLKPRDKVSIRVLGQLPWRTVKESLKVSRFNGYYVDVRGLLK